MSRLGGAMGRETPDLPGPHYASHHMPFIDKAQGDLRYI